MNSSKRKQIQSKFPKKNKSSRPMKQLNNVDCRTIVLKAKIILHGSKTLLSDFESHALTIRLIAILIFPTPDPRKARELTV